MTAQTEIVKSCFDSDQKVGTATAMTTDARSGTAPISKVVVTCNAIHRAMLVVWESQHQRIAAADKRLTHDQCRAVAHQCEQREERAENQRQDELRMPSEHQPAGESGWSLRRPSPIPRTQEREQHDARQKYVYDDALAAVNIATRCHHVNCESYHQQARRAHVHCLKVPMTSPKSRADDSHGRDRKKEQHQQRDDSGVFVPGRGRLQMFNDPVIGGEGQSDVEDCGCEHQPAEKLVMVQRERTCGSGTRSNRQHAQNEATGDRAQSQALCNFPCCRR